MYLTDSRGKLFEIDFIVPLSGGIEGSYVMSIECD